MEMRQLKIFCAVAELGSFTAAAINVNTVQSNVTMRVKELETELNRDLFIRKKSGVVLTSAGETFLGYARRILQLTDESRSALMDTGVPSGLLRLGSMETTAAIRLPQVLTRYRERFPEVRLSLLTGTTAELIKAIETHRLDGAFVGGFHQNSALAQDVAFEEELVLVSSSHFDSLATLIEQMPQQTVLVFRTGCFYRSTLENWFYQVGLVPNQIMELGTLDGILSCVAAGMGVTLLPRAIAESCGVRHAIHCHTLPAEFANVSTVFIRRSDTMLTSALSAFIELAQEHINRPTIQ
ncbi:LysR family transcriptional regulator [Pseudomonas gingeri]|uniref:LysR family transcriptional regulator n=1 Tax=Pseudomonas gingeri TaxID=117681 RepID=UPI0015A37914|nr:LysR family transcriptional regulator [Pseudomonas gingeri]NWD05189.1 LysR family transcriptional regulator [Pseudomonas gingeri]NWE36399.1 LysR family transcriptional regulator [Pseudomonas gingeri]NWE57136.1 LysR family transcriptional regulator [Pseudomonas gingeri]NWF00633.1 LysR family transcriptional regulator [Pseudomonas gingeri]